MRKWHTKSWPCTGHVSFALAGALGVLAFSSPDPAAARSAKLETAYVVLGGQGAIARTILTATNKCPPIRVGRSTKRMSVRARPNGAFPVLVCETLISRGTTSAAIGRRDLPLPKRSLARVVTFGDTGCRVEAPEKGKSGNDHYEPGQYQDCNEQMALRAGEQSSRRPQARPCHPCRRLSLSRKSMPKARQRLQGNPLRGQLARLARRLLCAGRSAAFGCALDHGARQSRNLQTRRIGLPPCINIK